MGTAQDAGIAIQDDSTDTVIQFNGIGAGEHEDFVLKIGDIGFDFTKTAGKPYDIAVTAALILLKKELGGGVVVTSDGGWSDWEGGRLLYETVYNEVTEVNFLGV